MALATCLGLFNIDTEYIHTDKDFQGFVGDCLNVFLYYHEGFRYNSSQCNNLCHAFIAKLSKYFANNWHILIPTKEIRFTKNSKCINDSKLDHMEKIVIHRAWKEMYRVVKEAQIYLQDCSSFKNWWMKSITSSICGEAYPIHIHNLVWSVICLDMNHLYFQAQTEQSYTEISCRKIEDFYAEMSNLTRIHDEYHDRKQLVFIFQQLLKACEMSAHDEVSTINVEERNKLAIAKFMSAKLQVTIRGEPAVIGSQICSWLLIDSKDLICEQRVIGKGSYGTVYEGSWLGVKVAVKEIPLFQGDMDYLAPEIAAHAKLQSPFVVQLIGICITETNCYFVMELVSSSLDRILEDRSAPLALPVAVDMMLQISRGMEYLHSQRIMHMDLKASNVLIQPSPLPEFRDHGYGRVKICDFGDASLRLSSFRYPEDTKGTCMWRAPEVFSFAQQGVEIEMTSPKEYTSKADVYSFAMTCYEILTGEHPFKDVPPEKAIYGMVVRGKRPSFPPSCPSVLAGFIQKCWDTDPNCRPCFAEISDFMRYMKLLIMRITDSGDWVSFSNICRDFDKAQLVKCESNEEDKSDDRAPNSVEEGLIIRALEGDFPAFFNHRCLLQQSTQPLAPKIKVCVKNIFNLPDYIQQYSYEEVQSATDNFSAEVRGVSCLMWKGALSDGTQVSVKKQELEWSMTEISMLCQMHHPNAVRLRGIPAGFLAFDYMVMGSVAAKLFVHRSILNWTIRRKIGLGIARFVAYLHNDHMKRFLNVEINATNVYLDERFTPKFGGFGSILPIEVSSQSLSSVDQQLLELALQFEEFRNVQDFGVILFELLTGRRWENMEYSLQSIHDSIQGEEGIEFIQKRLLDRVLEGEVEMGEAMRWVRLALWCFARCPSQKPTMNKVVLVMKEVLDVSPLAGNEMFKSFRRGQRVYVTTKEQYSNVELSEMVIAWVVVKNASSDKQLIRSLPFSSERSRASSSFSAY